MTEAPRVASSQEEEGETSPGRALLPKAARDGQRGTATDVMAEVNLLAAH